MTGSSSKINIRCIYIIKIFLFKNKKKIKKKSYQQRKRPGVDAPPRAPLFFISGFLFFGHFEEFWSVFFEVYLAWGFGPIFGRFWARKWPQNDSKMIKDTLYSSPCLDPTSHTASPLKPREFSSEIDVWHNRTFKKIRDETSNFNQISWDNELSSSSW